MFCLKRPFFSTCVFLLEQAVCCEVSYMAGKSQKVRSKTKKQTLIAPSMVGGDETAENALPFTGSNRCGLHRRKVFFFLLTINNVRRVFSQRMRLGALATCVLQTAPLATTLHLGTIWHNIQSNQYNTHRLILR